MDHEERLDRHGKTIAEHSVRLGVAETNIEAIEEGQVTLWKNKVSLERYIWVERFVVGACGAILYWAFQHLTAAQALIDASHK